MNSAGPHVKDARAVGLDVKGFDQFNTHRNQVFHSYKPSHIDWFDRSQRSYIFIAMVRRRVGAAMAATVLSALPHLNASALPSASNLPKKYKIVRVIVEDDSVKDEAKETDGK